MAIGEAIEMLLVIVLAWAKDDEHVARLIHCSTAVA